jgi:prevent-host-death family protein
MRKSNNVVGAYDAKTHFSELLARVAKGEEVTITRHGAAIARLVPVKEKPTRQQRQGAIEAMRKLASQSCLGKLRIKDLINEGRP